MHLKRKMETMKNGREFSGSRMTGCLEQSLAENFTLLPTCAIGYNDANESFYARLVKIGISP